MDDVFFLSSKWTQSVLIILRLSAESAIQTVIQTLQLQEEERKGYTDRLFGRVLHN